MADVSAGNGSIYSDIIENGILGMEECRKDKTGTLCRRKKCRDNKENNTAYKHFGNGCPYLILLHFPPEDEGAPLQSNQ